MVIAFAVFLPLLAAGAEAGKTCTCRANGKKFEQGQLLCIRGRLSRCEMFLNNPSWKAVAEDCPITRLDPPATLIERLGQLNPSDLLHSC